MKRSGFKNRGKPLRRRRDPEREAAEKAWGERIIARDKSCRWPTAPVGCFGRLCAHHVNERSQRPDLILDDDNGAAICFGHHDYAHHTLKGRQEARACELLGGETYEAAMKTGR